jgi:hypothetical protein
MISVFAGFNDGRLREDFEFIRKLGLRLDIAFNAAAAVKSRAQG